MSRVEFAIEQIESSRLYTLGLLDDVDPADWFRQPFEGANHVAWQVGHMMAAQYSLTLKALRGKRAEDREWFPADLVPLFTRESTPEADASAYPQPAELRAHFDRVHSGCVDELRTVDDATLDEEPTWPHPMCPTKRLALHFCARHELVHAGQIGMLRRAFGLGWLR